MPHLLLIDDDSKLTTPLRSSFERAGYDVSVAPDGHTGLSKALIENPDVVVLDVMMPGVDGRATLERLKERFAELPVILMTAKVQNEEIEEYLNLGAIGLIMKPFDPMLLPKEINDLYEKHMKN